MRMRHVPWSTILATLVVATVTCGPEWREDVISCEDAVAHLKECCPGLQVAPDYCNYREPDCEGHGDAPNLTASQSRCIRNLSCGQIVDAKLCDTTSNGSVPGDAEPRRVCP